MISGNVCQNFQEKMVNRVGEKMEMDGHEKFFQKENLKGFVSKQFQRKNSSKAIPGVVLPDLEAMLCGG